MAKIKIRMVESYSTYVVRDSFTIDSKDYPELDGLNEEEVIEYIQENNGAMIHKEWDQTMWEAAQEMDVMIDKITNDSYEIKVAVE